jgi:polysaccharide biosynthesis/export protein
MKMILPVAMALACTACIGPGTLAADPSVTLAEANVLPAPTLVGTNDRYESVLGPFDKVSIDVVGIESPGREYTLDGQGMISVPMAGAVMAEGLSTQELEGVIEQRLRDAYMRDPDVSVNLLEQQSQAIVVEGEVDQPGIYPVRRDLSLLSTIALAGGTTEISENSAVLVFRTVENQRYIGVYDLDAIRRGNYPDPVLYPDDTIVVGTSRTQRLLDRIQPFASLITTPLILLLRQ